MEKFELSAQEITAKIAELQELKRMREELDAEIESASNSIKFAMGDTESATFGPYKVTYKEVTTTRLDTAGIRSALPAEVLAPYMKTTVTRPLRIG